MKRLNFSLQSDSFYWLVLLAYASFIISLSFFHVPWRDEVAAVSTAAQSHSLGDLFRNLRDYGHPSLWYLILYFAFHLYPHYRVLKIVNILINVLSAGIFLKKAPFSWAHKILFLLGFYPLYQFSIINRGYGLFFLIFLLFCILYSSRWQKTLVLSAVLFLLCNSEAVGIIITVAVCLSMATEYFFGQKSTPSPKVPPKIILSSLAIVVVGIALSIWQTHLDSNSIIFSWSSLNIHKILSAIKQAVFFPGYTFPHIIGDYRVRELATLIIFGVYIILFRRPFALGIVVLSIIGISLTFQLFYPFYGHYHENSAYLLMLFAYWESIDIHYKNLSKKLINGLFMLIFVAQIIMACHSIKIEFMHEYSSSRALAHWIKMQPSEKNYVLIGEPDWLLESLPYYVPNDIYVPREKQFTKCVHWTIANKKDFSLVEFLQTAENLKKHGRNVLMVMGDKLSMEGPFEIKGTYNYRVFRYSPESLRQWNQKTVKVAEFRQSLNENYDAYVLK